MSALTEIFNHLYAYLICFINIVFGIEITFPKNEQVNSIIDTMGESYLSFFTPEQLETIFTIRPILFLTLGIFACGAVIGLFHRLIK